ncbi:hypothetical protein Scep_001253 [Stephania cephalantha]|uniref:Uncharacterized protein n=1 Tax=Stephania cephalantha TaxID=152367 RepID=A0AAP0L7J5_9MAGN
MVSEEKNKRDESSGASTSSTSESEWPDRPPQPNSGIKGWGILLFGLIGATVTTVAITRLKQKLSWLYSQISKSQSSWKDTTTGGSSFKEEAWNKYKRRMQEEYEEEMERVERIRRMQSVFNRERNKYKRAYESWRESDPGYHQHFQREDWYWKTEFSFKDQRANTKAAPRESRKQLLSHHYSVLGLDRLRAKPYTDAEIKLKMNYKKLLSRNHK